MSSTVFSIELKADPTLRLLVRTTGVAASILGFSLILTIPIDIAVRIGASVVWLFVSRRELRAIRAAYSRYRSLTLDHEGSVELVTGSGERQAAILLSSSIVLPGFAWLRLRSADGLCFGEFLRGDSTRDKQWRRLQVIWRHFGAVA